MTNIFPKTIKATGDKYPQGCLDEGRFNGTVETVRSAVLPESQKTAMLIDIKDASNRIFTKFVTLNQDSTGSQEISVDINVGDAKSAFASAGLNYNRVDPAVDVDEQGADMHWVQMAYEKLAEVKAPVDFSQHIRTGKDGKQYAVIRFNPKGEITREQVEANLATTEEALKVLV